MQGIIHFTLAVTVYPSPSYLGGKFKTKISANSEHEARRTIIQRLLNEKVFTRKISVVSSRSI
jgi:hypothetical protein